MTSTSSSTPSTAMWVKVAAVFGIIWYAFGLFQFWSGYSLDIPAAVESGAISPEYGAAVADTPLIVWIGFALASLAGLIGSVQILRRSNSAQLSFIVSLIALAVYFGWNYIVSGTAADRPFADLIVTGVVTLVTLAFFALSLRVAKA